MPDCNTSSHSYGDTDAGCNGNPEPGSDTYTDSNTSSHSYGDTDAGYNGNPESDTGIKSFEVESPDNTLEGSAVF